MNDIDRDALRADVHDVLNDDRPDPTAAWWATKCAALLDALDRAEAQSAIRGRAVVIYQQRARDTETRINAVRDVHAPIQLREHTGSSWASAPDDLPVCAHCTDPDAGWHEPYSCPTLRALDGTVTTVRG